ncbi:MAG TPA: hypothetical protein DDX71_02755 [Ruminococcus sp.]|nr:hypothetical protein [Ruminococcus sp.]
MNEITTRILKMLLLVFAVVLASTIFYHLLFQDYETVNATYYEVTDSSHFQGVYIRDESVLRYSGTGAVRYCADDGAKLGVGSVIAEIYDSEDQIDLRRRIAEKQDELNMLRKIENPGTTEHAQPASISALIEEQYKTMVRLRESGNFSAIADCKQEMTVLLSTYEKITNPDVNYSSRITALESEISALNAQKTAPLETRLADRSAYFISYADGYENILSSDSARLLTPEQIEAVSDEGAPDVDTSDAIGKLVDGYSWYIAGVFDNTKLRLSVDDTVTVRLESLSRPLRVKVVSLLSTGDISRTQALLRCDQITHDIVQHRAERVEILRDSVEGIRIPKSAIRFKDMEVTEKDEDGNVTVRTEKDVLGVYVLVGETPEFRRVQEIYKDENYYLSALDAGSGYVALYDEIIVKGVMADGG